MNRIKKFLLTALWQDPNYEVEQVSCPEISIEAIDEKLYGVLLSQATDAGAKFNGLKANISDCEFDWNYDLSSQTLNITCNKKPFFISCGEVESKIRKLVSDAKGGI